MVKEYIERQKKATEDRIMEKQEEMKRIQEKEKIICGNLERIKQSDIDFEIFSPRTGEISLRDKIKAFEQELRKIRIEKKNLEESMENLIEEKKNFDIMLGEIEEMFHVKHFCG